MLAIFVQGATSNSSGAPVIELPGLMFVKKILSASLRDMIAEQGANFCPLLLNRA